MKKYLTLLVLQFLLLGLTQVNASHVTGEAITLRQLPNGNSVFQIWVVRDCSGIFFNDQFLTIQSSSTAVLSSVVCSFVSTQSISNECIPNVFSNFQLNCPTGLTSGIQGTYNLRLYESQPINLSQYTFSPNRWIDFFTASIPCCAPNYSNINPSASYLNSVLKLKTNRSGKIITQSTVRLKEWPQTTYTFNGNSLDNSWMVSFNNDSARRVN